MGEVPDAAPGREIHHRNQGSDHYAWPASCRETPLSRACSRILKEKAWRDTWLSERIPTG